MDLDRWWTAGMQHPHNFSLRMRYVDAGDGAERPPSSSAGGLPTPLRLPILARMTIHIGTSGWSYDHWHGVLYPHGAPARARLEYYVQRFQTVELNASYYRWPADHTFVRWHRRLPEGFQMSVKAPRGLSHFKRLYEPERWLARMRHGLRYLGRKRGVLLVQLPPTLGYDYARLAYFLEQLPPWLKTAVEFRHPSWHREEVFRLLERHGVAYCVMSGAHLPCILRATAPFVYVRLHGPDPHHLYGGFYGEDDLRWWARRIREWAGMGLDVYA
ncbi:MAG: DUF72 domain-containing protein, partial [Candidatus Promineifilaceae bacterium]|nr:DUF72 domain-containing protein [Candidatus Promineifilaceae bacterium]